MWPLKDKGVFGIKQVISSPKSLTGIVKVPGDKSISHRAVMLGALAEGDTRIENFLPGEDCVSTVNCFKAMGVEFTVEEGGTVVTVHGGGVRGLREPTSVLDAGNSGTTMRLLLGILAGQPFFSVITGDGSLVKRPMARVTGLLSQMGAGIWGRQGANYAPLAVKGGKLKGARINSPVASAQVKSAVLLAGLFAEGETTLVEPALSRDHTERMLGQFGAEVTRRGNEVSVKGEPLLKGCNILVPGDISSAAFIIVAASIVPGSDVTITGVGVNPTRDGILEVLRKMGADITVFNDKIINGEPVADIRVRYAPLRGVEIGGDMIPRLIDEIPVLAVAAATAAGETVIRDAAELKVKETNRIRSVVEELGKLGADIRERPDGMTIRGGRLQGAVCSSKGDHRMAMSAAVAGLAAQGQTEILEAECVNISFPGFFNLLNSLRE